MKNKTLNVFLHRSLAGQLHQDPSGQITFSYDAPYLDSPNPQPLSHSLPLQPTPFLPRECAGFFSGILPEEKNRDLVAAILGISARNDFALLQHIGGECAGAITFLPEDQALQPDSWDYQELSNTNLVTLLSDLPSRPLLAGQEGIRISLAGAQDKISVRYEDGKFYLPLAGAPSTHILKPASTTFPSLIENEAFCLNLAQELGLPAVSANIHTANSTPFLLVERYDRYYQKDNTLRRIHQEDFCQALNIPSFLKYQSEGGPSLPDCFKLLEDTTTTPATDLPNLLSVVIFNFLIGNNDAHGKNFSLLYNEGKTTLAPFYDLISTTFYRNLSQKMAMKIGSRYHPDQVALRHFHSLADSTSLSHSQITHTLQTLTEKMLKALKRSKSPFAPFIIKRCLITGELF